MNKAFRILLFTAISCAIALPAFAGIPDVTFNRVSIFVDGYTCAKREANIENSDLPSSITYKDTTYVPLRFISGNMGKNVGWNGDSKTVSITDEKNRYKLIAEKKDLNGNVWKYECKEDDYGRAYITVTDKERNFTRDYPIQGYQAYKTDEESVWFVHANGILYRLYYANDENTQDGEEVTLISSGHPVNEAIIEGDYIYCTEKVYSNGSQGNVIVYNMITNEKVSYPAALWSDFSDLKLGISDDEIAVLYFNENSYTGYVYNCKITLNKKDMTFGKITKDDSAYEKSKKIKEDGITLEDFDFLTNGIYDM